MSAKRGVRAACFKASTVVAGLIVVSVLSIGTDAVLHDDTDLS
jgi:hypothetical protein